MKKKKKAKARKQLIISIIVLSLLIVLITIGILTKPTYSKTETKKYYTGDLLSPNYSANLIDKINSKDNIVISPYNYIYTLSILYNGSDNNTAKELKRYLNNNLTTQNELIIPTIKELNTKKEYNTKVESYYNNLIKELTSNSYNTITPKEVKLLKEEDKNKLLLLITKLNMTYDLLNNNYPYDLSYIKNYSLTKKELQTNETELYNILITSLENYDKYLTRNIINNNSIFIYNKINLPDIKINKEFNDILKQYNSRIIEYNKKTNIKELNKTIKELTDYNFYLDESILNNNFISLNSLYLEYNFQEGFDPNNTQDEEFYLSDNTKVITTMMYHKDNTYYENEYAYAIKKEFENNKYSFIAILPKEEGEYELSNLSLNTLLNNKKNKEVLISIPRFTYTNDIDLLKLYKEDKLEELLLEKINLSNISNTNLQLNYIHQKITISIGEKGTKNSIYNNTNTKIQDDELSSIKFNRPFSFLVIDNTTNNVYLIGKVNNPK